MKKSLLLAACFVAAAAMGWSLEMKLAHVYESTHPYHIGSEWAAEEVAKATEGRVTIKVYPSSTLGSENELMEQVFMGGDLDIANVGSAQIANAWPAMNITVMPYVFRDNDHLLQFLKSPTYEKLCDAFYRDTGCRMMGASTWGLKHTIGNKAITTPEDFKNFRLRVPEQKATIKVAQYMGANPTPTAYSEAYMALQQNVVDGLENPFSAIQTMKFFEVAKVISKTGHVIANNHFLVNDESYMAMNEHDRAEFKRILGDAGFRIHKMIDDADASLEPWLLAQGCSINEIDRDAFVKATAGMVQEYESCWKEFGDLYTEIQSIR